MKTLREKIEEACAGEETRDVLTVFACLLVERVKASGDHGLASIVLSMLSLAKLRRTHNP